MNFVKMCSVCIVLLSMISSTGQAQHVNSRILGKLIYIDIPANYDHVSAQEVMDEFENELGILMNILWEDDEDEGLDPTLPITLELPEQPAVQILERIVAQLDPEGNATWQLRDGALEIGLKSELASTGRQRLESYYIQDLLFTIRDFSSPNLQSPTGAGGSGGAGGGGGGTGGFGGTGGTGGSGGSGGAGGGAGGSGGGIGDGEESPEPTEEEQIERLVELIETFVEPDVWEQNGGTCTIDNFQSTLLVRAPDFVHRQINGYSFKPSRPTHLRERRFHFDDDKIRVIIDRRPLP